MKCAAVFFYFFSISIHVMLEFVWENVFCFDVVCLFCNGIFKTMTRLPCKMSSFFPLKSSFVQCNQRNIKNVSFLYEFVFLFCKIVDSVVRPEKTPQSIHFC